MKSILVTGGAGLIGSHVVDLLVHRGNSVRVIDSLVAPTHDGPPDWLNPSAHYVIGDIRDPVAVREALNGVDTLVHLAAHGGFVPGTREYFDVNVTGYANLIDEAAVTGSLKRAVIASSQGVYGLGGLGVDESDPCPRTPYALSKMCLETIALGQPDIDTTALRFSLTYGSRQSATNPYCGIVSLFSQRMRRRRPVLVYEDGRQLRDFVHVSDVARAIADVIYDERTHGHVYNVGTGVGTPVSEIVEVLAELWHVEPDVWLPGWRRPGDVRHLVTDAGRLRALGWAPRVSVREGLAEYVDWARGRPLSADPFDEALEHMRATGVVQS